MSGFDLAADYGAFELRAAAQWDVPCAALFGASGSGKTTVLEALAGVRPGVRGSVVLGERSVTGLTARERGVGWVPQDAALFPHLTAGENIRFGAEARRPGDAGDAPIDATLDEALEVLEIGHLLGRRAADLSGGERQRVALARALASRPSFLLLDEPLASIDRPLRARLLPFLQSLPERTGVPMLVVTHDPLEVVALAGFVAVLERGKVVTSGQPASVFASAATFGALYALGAENRFDVRVIARGAGTLTLMTGAGTSLSMAALEGFPDPTRVAVRAEDVMLAAERPARISAQNIWSGTVEGLEAIGAQVTVRVESAGERWQAKVTAGAVRSLDLAPGREVFLLVKAHAIVPCA